MRSEQVQEIVMRGKKMIKLPYMFVYKYHNETNGFIQLSYNNNKKYFKKDNMFFEISKVKFILDLVSQEED